MSRAVLGLAVATYFASQPVAVHAQGSRDIRVKPFSVSSATISYTMKSAGEVEGRTEYKRRSDGAVCEKLTHITPLSASTLRKLTFPDGRSVLVSDGHKMRSTLYLTDRELAEHKESLQPKTGCSFGGEAPAGTDQIAAASTRYAVQRQHRFLPAGNGMSRQTSSRIPEPGCFQINNVEEIQNADGSFTKRWERRSSDFADGEPPEADFVVPEAYAEVRPSTILKLTHLADVFTILAVQPRGVTVPKESLERIEEQLAREDAYYDKHQQK